MHKFPIYFFKRRRIRLRTRRRRKARNRNDYLLHKEEARSLLKERIEYFQKEYSKIDPSLAQIMEYKKLAVRNMVSRWGSCSSAKNLNFNYRILHLSQELRDYIIVHELCHLKELHHGKSFWNLVQKMMPDAIRLNKEAKRISLS
jgi:predicted metal-dependent hydrolase